LARISSSNGGCRRGCGQLERLAHRFWDQIGILRLARGGFCALYLIFSATCRGPTRALALVFLEEALADADGGGGDFDELVVVDELDGLLEGEADRRAEGEVLVLG